MAADMVYAARHGYIAAILGRKGGSAKSAEKTAAVRENGKKGGRPRKREVGQKKLKKL